MTVLNLSDNENLERPNCLSSEEVGYRISFPNLRYVKFNNCKNLREISIDAEKLVRLEALKCSCLTAVKANCLEALDVRGSLSVDDDTIDATVHACFPKKLLLQGCPRIKSPLMREVHPHWTTTTADFIASRPATFAFPRGHSRSILFHGQHGYLTNILIDGIFALNRRKISMATLGRVLTGITFYQHKETSPEVFGAMLANLLMGSEFDALKFLRFCHCSMGRSRNSGPGKIFRKK